MERRNRDGKEKVNLGCSVVRPTWWDRVLEIVAGILAVVLTGLSLAIYLHSPGQIPIHFNYRGEADGWGSGLGFCLCRIGCSHYGHLCSGCLSPADGSYAHSLESELPARAVFADESDVPHSYFVYGWFVFGHFEHDVPFFVAFGCGGRCVAYVVHVTNAVGDFVFQCLDFLCRSALPLRALF